MSTFGHAVEYGVGFDLSLDYGYANQTKTYSKLLTE